MNKLMTLWMALLLATTPAAAQAEKQLEAARHKEVVEGDLKAAADQYRKIAAQFAKQPDIAARALYQLGLCQEKLGQAEARKSYERVVKEYPGAAQFAAQARARLAAISQPVRAGVSASQVWTEHWFGAPSANGRTLVIMDQKTGDILAHDLISGEKRILSKYEPADPSSGWWYSQMNVAITADGRQVAFNWRPANANHAEIRTSSVDNPKPRVIWKGDQGASAPQLSSYSADGKLIAFRRALGGQGPIWEIGLLTVADGSIRTLKQVRTVVPGDPQFSPDGRHLTYAFVRASPRSDLDIASISIADGSETDLVNHSAQDLNPVWTPDGTGIVFASNRRGSMDLWFQRVSDGRPAGPAVMTKGDLPAGSLPSRLLGFTRGGSLYFGRRTVAADVMIAEFDQQAGRLKGQPRVIFDSASGMNAFPTLSRDGRSLAVFRTAGHDSYQRSVARIWQASNQQYRDLPVALPPVSYGVWKDDGISLLLRTDEASRWAEFYELNVNTGEHKLVFSSGKQSLQMAYNPVCYSPDFRTIYYAAFEQKPAEALQIMALDLESGQARQVLREEKIITQLGCSPDGNSLVYTQPLDSAFRASSMKVVSVRGGQSRVILASTADAGASVNVFTPLQWSPDGKSVYFQGVLRTPKITQDLFRVPVEGGTIERVGLRLEPLSRPTFSQDGRFVAYRGPQTDSREIWALENFLPAAPGQNRDTSRGKP